MKRIPLYFNFRFYALEIAEDLFQSQRSYEYSITYFWETLLTDLFKTEILLQNSVINWPVYKDKEFGITMFTTHSPQYNNDKVLYPIESIIENRLKIKDGRYDYEEHRLDDVIVKFQKNDYKINNDLVSELVRVVNYNEREIFEWLCENSRDKKWDRLQSDFMTDKFMRKKIRRDGVPDGAINYDLISIEKLVLETKRKLKNLKQ